MKTLTPLFALAACLASVALFGCSQSAAPASSPANDALVNKLNSMPASQRADYAKAHMDEVMKAAGSQRTK